VLGILHVGFIERQACLLAGAVQLGVSRRFIYDMIRKGLPLYQIGTRCKIMTADVVEYASSAVLTYNGEIGREATA
jgi:excisionase family DNA binding protein